MNKVILMGRLTRDPEIRYSQGAEPMAVARYTLAVNRRFKRQGDADADFINCVAFGRNAEFAEKFLRKGQMIGVVGRLQVRAWDDNSGQRRWSTDVVVEEHYFAESKNASESYRNSQQTGNFNAPKKSEDIPDDFYPIDESIEDEDLPF